MFRCSDIRKCVPLIYASIFLCNLVDSTSSRCILLCCKGKRWRKGDVLEGTPFYLRVQKSHSLDHTLIVELLGLYSDGQNASWRTKRCLSSPELSSGTYIVLKSEHALQVVFSVSMEIFASVSSLIHLYQK